MPHGAIAGMGKVSDDGVTTTSRGTAVTAAATAHTKGAYAQIIASTAHAAKGFLVQLGNASAGVDYSVDIAIGGAGSEIIIVADLLAGSGTGSIARQGAYFIPIPIPAGTRVSARCQATTLSSALRAKVHLLGDLPGGMEPFGKCVRYGFVSATTQGTTIDPGATANTKGAWTQLVAATTYAIKALWFDTSNLVQVTRTSADWLLDLGIGGAGAELVIAPNFHIEASTTDDTLVHGPSPLLPVSIPAGSRLSARCMSSLNTATVRNLAVAVYGLS
jgi:hypothetical protein